MLDESLSDLGADDVERRVRAVARLAGQPEAARPRLAALVADQTASAMARVWGTIALCHVGDDASGSAVAALLLALNAGDAVVRWSAIGALGSLKAESAVAAIGKHLDHNEEVSGAWFEDDCRPSQAARRALREIGTPAAMARLEGGGAG